MTDTIDSANQGSATAQIALERLGLSLDDLNGMTTEQQFDAITAALADMEEGAERNAIGNDLLGKRTRKCCLCLMQAQTALRT